MSDFYERLRGDAAGLRYEPDTVALARMTARIRGRVAEPTVTELLARWFRPVAAAVTALAIIAAIGAATVDTPNDDFAAPAVDLTVAGDNFHVGE
jgi:hypothetical protein